MGVYLILQRVEHVPHLVDFFMKLLQRGYDPSILPLEPGSHWRQVQGRLVLRSLGYHRGHLRLKEIGEKSPNSFYFLLIFFLNFLYLLGFLTLLKMNLSQNLPFFFHQRYLKLNFHKVCTLFQLVFYKNVSSFFVSLLKSESYSEAHSWACALRILQTYECQYLRNLYKTCQIPTTPD